MAWERRRNSLYYYRSVWEADGRVRKEYLGNGAKAHIAASQISNRKRQDRLDDEAIAEFCLAVGNADQAIDAFATQCRLMLEAQLLADGYHKHRGQWRKKGCQGRPRKRRNSQQKIARSSPAT